MNKAFYIIAIPAFIVSFCWLYYGWGLGTATVVILVELVAAVGGMIHLRRKESARRTNEESGDQ